MKLNFKNISMYLIGIILMALSVTLMKQTFFGMGGWDAVISNIHTLTKIKLGTSSLIINIILLTSVIIYRRNLKFLNALVPIFLNTIILNYLDGNLFLNVTFDPMWERILMFVISALILPLSLSLLILSTLPKMVYDEITYILLEIFKKENFGAVRLAFEVATLLLAMTLGLIGGNIFMQIGIGTIIVTFTLGYLIEFFLKINSVIFKVSYIHQIKR